MKSRILWCWKWDRWMSEFFPHHLFEVRVPSTGPVPCKEDELERLISDIDFLVVRRYYQITRRLIEKGQKLKLIQRAGADYDNIDIGAAREVRIPVANMPMAIDASVAELTILLMLALSKKLIQSHQNVVNGEYQKLGLKPMETSEYKIMGNWMGLSIQRLFQKTLGIVGLGEIGKLVAKRARGFGMKVIYYKRKQLNGNEEKALGVQYSDFRSLLREADFVTLHVPLTEQTRQIIGRKELSLMKRTSFIINTSRGGVIDENALYEVLKNKEIGGAGLDVFVKEPIPRDHPLLTLDNVILTPHIGGGSVEALRYDLRRIRDNITRIMEGKRPVKIVNDL